MKLLRRTCIAVAAIAVLLGCVFGIWSLIYPGPADAKCPRYVLWKLGLFPFDAEVVLPSMVGDAHADQFVVGRTTAELERRFGRLRTRAEATPDYQKYYGDRFFLDSDIRWLDDSPWLVIFEHGRAKELRLMKG